MVKEGGDSKDEDEKAVATAKRAMLEARARSQDCITIYTLAGRVLQLALGADLTVVVRA